MLLLLIRHAQAAEQDETSYPDDSLRPLVAKGRKVQRRMCKQLRRRDLVPSRVFSSPWKRAWQTARIVIDESGLPKDARLPCQALAAPPDLAALAAEIGEVGADETIALVGHEPWMSELASLLLTGKSAGLQVDFAKSGIMGIETAGLRADSGGGTLRFFLVP
jgi:phosphohistidine phosphatase